MTLLHQAAQKAVEALKKVDGSLESRGEYVQEISVALVTLQEALRKSALQHQEEPSTAVIPPAPPECETEDEKTAFSFGYWQGLHAARKGQEVPREPAYDWKAIAEHYEAALRHLAENAFASKDWQFARAALNAGAAAAKLAVPSTTRQQEVGSAAAREAFMDFFADIVFDDPDAVSVQIGSLDTLARALGFANLSAVESALAAAPSTPENAGGVSDGVGGNDGVDLPDGGRDASAR